MRENCPVCKAKRCNLDHSNAVAVGFIPKWLRKVAQNVNHYTAILGERQFSFLDLAYKAPDWDAGNAIYEQAKAAGTSSGTLRKISRVIAAKQIREYSEA